MANIVSSSFSTGVPQIDGRIWVVETHDMSDGTQIISQFLADNKLDLSDHLAKMAAAINAEQASSDTKIAAEAAKEADIALKTDPTELADAVSAYDTVSPELWIKNKNLAISEFLLASKKV